MKHRCLNVILFIMLFTSLLIPTQASAYDYQKYNGKPLRWPHGRVISWYLNTNALKTIPATKVQAAFQRAFQNWQKIRCAKLVFVFRGMTTAYSSGKKSDGKNVIAFNPTVKNLYRSNLIWDKKGFIKDFDIELSTTIKWSLNPQGNEFDLESVAASVIGNLIGLTASTVTDATMYNRFSTDDISKRSLHKDDIDGACFLYPSGKKEQCLKDSDCPVGLGCDSKKNCIPKAPPVSPKVCKSCASKSNCDKGMTCDFLGNGKVCLHHCTADNKCPPKYSCSGSGTAALCLPAAGLCPTSGCKSNADCSSGQRCRSGKCGPECDKDADCPPSRPLCKQGACKQKVSGGCQSDTDCKAGESCQNAVCVKCQTGSTKTCKCSNGNAGKQSCQSGTWTACKCQGSGNICSPGGTQSCTCSNGQKGAQTCAVDGKSWQSCKCQGGGNICSPGGTQACTCSNGQKGAQTCATDGKSWQTCKCQGGGNICKANTTQACTCTNGKQGNQTCANDGKSWQTCQCKSGGNVCSPGGTQSCTCTNGKQGSQTCTNDGKSWQACKCQGGGNQACTPGATQACQCPAGQGSQACLGDGSGWQACKCQACTPGATQACVCTNGKKGSQLCDHNGSSWGTCSCQGGGGGGGNEKKKDAGTQADQGSNRSCQSDSQCPAGYACTQNICQIASSGCGCQTTHGSSFPSGPLGLLLSMLIIFKLRRKSQKG